MAEYELVSPFVTLTFTASLSRRKWSAILAGWLALWAVICVALIYAYAVVFAGRVGFETALLVGVAIIILGLGSDR